MSFRIVYIVLMFNRSMRAGLKQDRGKLSQSAAYTQWLSVTRAVTGFRIKEFMRPLLESLRYSARGLANAIVCCFLAQTYGLTRKRLKNSVWLSKMRIRWLIHACSTAML